MIRERFSLSWSLSCHSTHPLTPRKHERTQTTPYIRTFPYTTSYKIGFMNTRFWTMQIACDVSYFFATTNEGFALRNGRNMLMHFTQQFLYILLFPFFPPTSHHQTQKINTLPHKTFLNSLLRKYTILDTTPRNTMAPRFRITGRLLLRHPQCLC